MGKAFYFLILPILIVSASSEAAELCSRILHSTISTQAELHPDTELAVYRFYSQNDTNQAWVGVYGLFGGMFQPKEVGQLEYKIPHSKSPTSLLNHLQSFSIHVMREVGYISGEAQQRQSKLLEDIHPEQVTFLEITRPIEKTDPALKSIAKENLSLRPDLQRPHHVHTRQAALWIINGQYLWPHDREAFWNSPYAEKGEIPFRTSLAPIENNEGPFDLRNIVLGMRFMFWQTAKDLIQSGKMPVGPGGHFVLLDRKEYPITFELGRAAQVSDFLLERMLKASTAIMQEEVVTSLQAETAQAYVFAKAMSPSRVRLFRKMGFEEFKPGCLGSFNCVMVIPLDKLIEKYSVSTISFRVNELKKRLPNFAEFDLLNYLRRIQVNFRAELDVLFEQIGLRNLKNPVVVHDFSSNYFNFLGAFLGMGGIQREQAWEIVNGTAHWRYNFNRADANHFDEIPIEPFQKYFEAHNVIRITNLDLQHMMNKEFTPLLLIGVDEYMLRKYKEVDIVNGEFVLDQTGTKYALQTTSSQVAEILRRYGATEMATTKIKKGNGQEQVYSFIFSRKQVLEFKKRLAEKAAYLKRGGVDQGFWFFRALSSLPIKF